MKTIVCLILFVCFNWTAEGQTCTGKWITIDDETNKKKSIVELYKDDKKLYGKITYLYPREGREENPKCTNCTDDRKNKPLIGLQIVRGLVWDGRHWEGGSIVDPENGKLYTVKLWLDETDKNRLNVRGYVGPFYRTQQWIRTD